MSDCFRHAIDFATLLRCRAPPLYAPMLITAFTRELLAETGHRDARQHYIVALMPVWRRHCCWHRCRSCLGHMLAAMLVFFDAGHQLPPFDAALLPFCQCCHADDATRAMLPRQRACAAFVCADAMRARDILRYFRERQMLPRWR